MRLYPLFSSSKGNCYYLGTRQAGVLIDAGGSARRIISALAAAGIHPSAVSAIFVTHEHSDHMKALAVLLKRLHVPVFATPGTVSMLAKELSGADLRSFSDRVEFSGGGGGGTRGRGAFGGKTPDRWASDGDDLTAGERADPGGSSHLHFEAAIIRTSHDSAESCGYRFDFAETSVSLLTDSGIITDDFSKALSSETVVLESNYDPFSLSHGDYPPHLKARIAGRFGHLSNDAAASFASVLINYGTKNILLAHLSEQNNTPELAKTAFLSATAGFTEGKEYFLKILPPVVDNWFCAV
jgi:phosphoribosyl 1,2-cyclic phosphodiesterase